MFKNLTLFRFNCDLALTLPQLEDVAQTSPFIPCGPSQERSVGWVPPRGEKHGPLVEAIAGVWLLKLMFETKSVPAPVVVREVAAYAEEIEVSTGRKPGKKEMREIKEDVMLALIPKAFAKQSAALVVIDPASNMVWVDTGSPSRGDDVAACLAGGIEGLQLTFLKTVQSPAIAMSEWLLEQEAPAGFSIDRECELKGQDETTPLVRYARHALDIEEVQQHIQQGKLPTRLALTFDSRVSFVLTDTLKIKKLAFLDFVFEGEEPNADVDRFDADVAISTGEVRKLLPALLEALGGELV